MLGSFLIALAFLIYPNCAFGIEGNKVISDFYLAKKLLHNVVYIDHRRTLYCDAVFDGDKNVIPPAGFHISANMTRAFRMEVEHCVPAENFGRFFEEWRVGHPDCKDSKGKPFKGRKCASLINPDYKLMEADMYNLYPSIGAVNAARSNYNYAELPGVKSNFGSCDMKIDARKAEPPARAKGAVARASLYFEANYGPKYFRLSKQQKRLFEIWSNKYPVTKWECTRTRRIETLQKNVNSIVKEKCLEAGLW